MEWIFVKSFNNNAALVADTVNCEWIVVGNGVSFGKKKGEQIDAEKVERYFQACEMTQDSRQNLTAINNLQDRTLEVTSQIVNLFKQKTELEFTDHQYLALADHIQFSVNRAKEGISVDVVAVAWELPLVYPQEYDIAKEAKQQIEKTYTISLPESEIVFLMYHFIGVNNELEQMNDTVRVTNLIQQTLEIIQHTTSYQFGTDNLNYSRFLTHLRFFILKKIKEEYGADSGIESLLIEKIQQEYPESYALAKKIGNFYAYQEKWHMTVEELLYLTLHICRLTLI
ncbi:MAG: PRD domain-containing protein [Culicoidibacterales bacterium]